MATATCPFPGRWLPLLHLVLLAFLVAAALAAEAWTGEIRGRIVYYVCGDAAIGPEDHVLEVGKVEAPMLAFVNRGRLENLVMFIPYYLDAVLYSITKLHKTNEDGITTQFYLSKIYQASSEECCSTMGCIMSCSFDVVTVVSICIRTSKHGIWNKMNVPTFNSLSKGWWERRIPRRWTY